MLPGKASLLDSRKATTWAGGEGERAIAYPAIKVPFDQHVVTDGKYLTSNDGVVSNQAALALLTSLRSENFSKEIAESIQLNRLEASPTGLT